MKWLSVRKYKPIEGFKYFIMTSNQSIYVGYYNKQYNSWYHSTDCAVSVTHFCIPDPIEEEE